MKKLSENYPSSKWCFSGFFLEDKMTKDPWLFWRGGVEVERWIFGKSWVCPAWSSWKGRRHSAGSQIVRTTLPPNGVFWFLFRRQDDKGPVVVLEGGGGGEWIFRKSWVCPALSSWKGKRHSAGSQIVRTTLPPNGVFLVSFRRQDDKGPVVVLEGGGGGSLEVNLWQVLGLSCMVAKFKVYWDLDFEPSEKTRGGQAMAFVGLGIWLGGNCLSWILIVDPWVLSPDMPLAASHCYLDCPEPPNHPKSLVVLQGGAMPNRTYYKGPVWGCVVLGGGGGSLTNNGCFVIGSSN